MVKHYKIVMFDLMWIAISEKGMSGPYFRSQKVVAIKSRVYIEECLEKRLLPFIHKHHPEYNYLFWPDLVSAHYSRETVSWIEENVYFVEKDSNPPNIPQTRPIENLWGFLVQKVYEGGWHATTEKQLVARIQSQLKKIDVKFLQTLMRGVKTKIRAIADGGPLATYKK